MSKFDFHYVKLLLEPLDDGNDGPANMPIDTATLVPLLNRATTDAFGNVGAGAIGCTGHGVDVVWIGTSPVIVDGQARAGGQAREVILKVASPCVVITLLAE